MTTLLTAAASAASDLKESSMLSMLRKEHPRIVFLRDDEARVQRLRKEDPVYEQIVRITLNQADRALDEATVEHKKIGRRLLQQTRESLRRIVACAMVYRLTGEDRYLNRAEREMLAAAALPDWNPSHFLDAAEMAAGLAIGYDWLYADLSPETRQTVRTAMIEKAIRPSFEMDRMWWITGKNNWNPVCHGGLTLAALAMAEDEPELAERVVERAVQNVPIAMKESYDPEGVYPEGPTYWVYGTSFNVLLIAALDSALGQDFGLSDLPGFERTALYHLVTVGPDGAVFQYYDCGRAIGPISCPYWFAKRFNDPALAWRIREMQRPLIEKAAANRNARYDRLFPLALAWYTSGTEPTHPLPLDYEGKGPNPIALFRSDWTDDALWLAVKGGNNRNSHNHMDAGEFVIVAGGIRWAEDLGSDDYSTLETLPGNLWGEGRYDFLRLSVKGHSTLMLNNALQDIDDSASPIVTFRSTDDRSFAVIDMSKPWKQQAASVRRGAAVLNKRSVLIQDEVTDCKGEILWQMVTLDSVAVDGIQATIKKRGKTFYAQILAPKDAVFETIPLKPMYEGENPNKGLTKLAFRVPPASGQVRLAVQLWLGDDIVPGTPTIIPLEKW